MVIKSLAQTLKDLAAGIKNTITGITSSNATLTIIKGNGTTSTVTVNNVANADAATKATQDSAGQQINSTYIKGLSVSGKTITYTKGNNTTGTITTQDTVYTHPNSGVTAGTYKSVTVNAQGHVIAGSNPTTLAGYGITDASLKGHTHNDIYYTESEIDSKVNTINSSLNNKSDTSHTHDDRYYTESEMNTKLSGKSDTTHTHDDIYYTESEIDSKVNTINTSINNKADKTHTHSQYLTASSELNVGKLKGVISLDNLPAGALERLVKVTNDTARFSLTTNDIQLGDTVKVESTKMMYIVKDITKLNSEDGYEQYTAGMASSVPWSGVTGKPSSYTPSAHTHDDRYYTESEINSKVNTINSSIDTKADKTHTHDDRYYTESEIDSKLSTKSPLIGSTSLSKLSSNVTFGDGGAFSITQNDGSWWQRLRTNDNNDKTQKRLIYEESQGNSGSSYTELFSVDGNGNIYAGGTLLSKNGHTHDDRYYTESEINTKLASKQNTLSAAGSATKGVYIDSSGTAKAMTYSVNKDVPNNAVFTDTVYTHPTTAGNKHIPSGGSSGQILRWSADGTAEWGADNNTTYSAATQSANGLMSAADKKKLDGIATGANAYTHPNSGVTAGTYRSVTVNAQGHVTAGSNPTTLSGYGITDAPTKTGGGASGTWGINITGNAKTATTANTATNATHASSADSATNADTVDGVHAGSLFYNKGIWDADNWATIGTYQVIGNPPVSDAYGYGQVISSSTNNFRFQLYASHDYRGNGRLHYRTGYNDDKQPWNTILDSENYNLFTPTKTGGGASGTWGINISGKVNSVSITKDSSGNIIIS